MHKEYACYSKDNRDLATSGGFCYEFAKYVFSNNGIVYGARYSDDFHSVFHAYVDNIDDYVKHLSKSKYAMSILPKFNIVEQQLKDNIIVGFIGCPCQVQALKRYLKHDYSNLLTIELICGGVSSRKHLEEFIDSIENKNDSKVIMLDMRYQHKLQTKCILSSGAKEYFDTTQTIIFRNRLEHCLKHCAQHFGSEYADIVVGDFWDNSNKNRLQLDQFSVWKGTNFVIIKSIKGQLLFDALSTSLSYIQLK